MGEWTGGPNFPWKHPTLETFDGALAFLQRDSRSEHRTALLGNPPDVSTFQCSVACYVNAALYTWQGGLVLYCIYECTALLTAFIKNSWLKEAERLQTSEWSGFHSNRATLAKTHTIVTSSYTLQYTLCLSASCQCLTYSQSRSVKYTGTICCSTRMWQTEINKPQSNFI